MSRSYRHVPVCGITMARSEAEDKRRAHRRLRVWTRALLDQPDLDVVSCPTLRDVSDPWTMAKDGKQRFDPQQHPKLIRK